MCSKLEGIFKHIGLTAMTQLSMEWHGISIPKKPETHETLVDVMSCRQDDVVKKIGMFDQSLDTHPSKTGATHLKARGSERE